ncbi:MAG: GFA family protein [Gammaproteobacteria bacterium]
MHLAGSCHCRAVSFTVEADQPYPFNLCYCSICRKTAGGGGYAINLGARADTLTVRGREHVRIYHARMTDPATGGVTESPGERYFCGHCGSALWVFDPRWPDLVHPFASAVDTPLPRPPEHTHMMLGSRPGWVPVHADPDDALFDAYPDESLAQWHERHGFSDAGE